MKHIMDFMFLKELTEIIGGKGKVKYIMDFMFLKGSTEIIGGKVRSGWVALFAKLSLGLVLVQR